MDLTTLKISMPMRTVVLALRQLRPLRTLNLIQSSRSVENVTPHLMEIHTEMDVTGTTTTLKVVATMTRKTSTLMRTAAHALPQTTLKALPLSILTLATATVHHSLTHMAMDVNGMT